MKCDVSSGNYITSLDRTTALEAATEAILLWDQKKIKPTLSEITTVKIKERSFLFLTQTLLENTLQLTNL